MLSSAIMAACQIKTFCTDKTKGLCSHTDIDFTELGKKKTALFIIDPEAEGYYAPVISLLHQHIVKALYKDLENREASIHVRFIMNKIPIYGTTPELPFYLATMRTLNISCSLVFQTIEQLKAEFPTNWKDVLGSCDTLLFLGTNDLDTARYMYCLLPGGGWFCGLPADKTEESSYDHLASDLMTMPTDKCVIFQNKLHPICCTKYDIAKHPNYKEIVNSEEKDLFTPNKPYIIQSEDPVGSEKIKPFCVFQSPETDPAS